MLAARLAGRADLDIVLSLAGRTATPADQKVPVRSGGFGGGRFLCLEFSACEVPVLDALYDFHSFAIIPRLGELATGSADPYRYLVESIRKFPDQRRFAAMVCAAGFARSSFRNLTGGIAAIHSAWRL